MFIYNQQALNTLNILGARHQKVMDEFQKKGPSETLTPDEVIQVMNSSNALAVYNALKQKYQPSV